MNGGCVGASVVLVLLDVLLDADVLLDVLLDADVLLDVMFAGVTTDA